MVANVLIVTAVAALLFVCIRSFIKADEKCSGCSVKGCTAHARKLGKCAAAQDMLARAEATLDKPATH